ncbi:MAG: hypothetical protein K1X72_04495 [Pyrinomonadaceae bacterium]|nr:hypothetical protein [Pyrinomonadaceae bacterium]
MKEIMEELEGVILTGNIVKDGEIILTDQSAQFSYNQKKSRLGKTAYEFHLTLEEKPSLELQDKCKLVTKDKTINLVVSRLDYPLERLCFITFVTDLRS